MARFQRHQSNLEDFDLSAYTPSGGWFARLNGVAENWQRNTVLEGDWQGTFTLRGEEADINDWFYERLGYHIRERSYGQRSWEGFIWEMDLITLDPGEWTRHSKRGKRVRRTYETLVNRVKVRYEDSDGNTQETNWFDDLASQKRYGIKEEIIAVEANAANAEDIAREFLQLYAGGNPTVVGLEENVEEPYLEITVVGHLATAQFRFVSDLDDVVTDVDSWVSKIISDDLDYLDAGTIQTNARSISRTLTGDMRAWALLEQLATLRDGSGNHYRLRVTPGQITPVAAEEEAISGVAKVNYVQWNTNPLGLFFNGRFTDRSYHDIEQRPRLIQPGIYRGTGNPLATSPSADLERSKNTFFESPDDMLIESFEVNAEGLLVPRLGVYDDEEALRSLVLPEIEGPAPPLFHDPERGTGPIGLPYPGPPPVPGNLGEIPPAPGGF